MSTIDVMRPPTDSYDQNKIINARLRLGWTRSYLATMCGLHYSTISRLESGEHQSPETVRRVAEVLNIPMSRMLRPLREIRRQPEPVEPEATEAVPSMPPIVSMEI